jgi:uncharacterized protein with GYD domain
MFKSLKLIKEILMAKFIIMGKYTAKGLGGFVSNPDTDRRAATTALSESVGAKLTGYAGLRGEYDFMVEVEGTFEQASASGMIAVSSGAVTDFSVHEVVDLNAIAKIANKATSNTKPMSFQQSSKKVALDNRYLYCNPQENNVQVVGQYQSYAEAFQCIL